MSEFISKKFVRKPRHMTEIDRWKGTELRQFLLYTGPIVLLNILPKHMYMHFLSFSIAIRILSDERLCQRLNQYAHELLMWFVT